MVQNYGSTSPTPPLSPPPPQHSTIMATRSHRRRRRGDNATAPGASVLSSFSNLANTIIGSGALAFPAAFASMGMIPGIVSCIFSACTAVFGLWCLSRCATLVGKQPGDEGRKASFNEVARLAFGKGWVVRVFDVGTGKKDTMSGAHTQRSWPLRSSALACRSRISLSAR